MSKFQTKIHKGMKDAPKDRYILARLVCNDPNNSSYKQATWVTVKYQGFHWT